MDPQPANPNPVIARTSSPELRIGLFQQRVPEYRLGVFESLAREPGLRLSIYSSSFASPVRGAACHVARTLRFGRGRLHPGVLWAALTGKQDVIICEGSTSVLTSLLLVILSRWRGFGTVWWTSLWSPDGSVGISAGLRGRLTKLALRGATAVLTYGRVAAAAARAAGVPSRRLFVATNSLDTEELGRIERRWRADPDKLRCFRTQRGLDGFRVVLFVGRLIPKKRVARLITAFAELGLTNDGPPLKLVIVGDGPDRAHLESVAHALGVGSRTLFCGAIHDSHEVCPYFLSAHVMVLPGPGGLAVNHALSHGVPTIVAGGDGTERDVIEDGRNGYLVPPDDAALLAKRIGEIATADASTWQSLSQHARKTISERSNVRIMIDAMVEAARCAAVEAGIEPA